MIEWWSEISKRAQSSTFTQPGDGSLAAISRSGSVMRSSSVMHPKQADHTQGPSPPYVAEVHLDEKVAIAAAPEAAAPPAVAPAPVAEPIAPVTAAASVPAPIPAAVPAPEA